MYTCIHILMYNIVYIHHMLNHSTTKSLIHPTEDNAVPAPGTEVAARSPGHRGPGHVASVHSHRI